MSMKSISVQYYAGYSSKNTHIRTSNDRELQVTSQSHSKLWIGKKVVFRKSGSKQRPHLAAQQEDESLTIPTLIFFTIHKMWRVLLPLIDQTFLD